MLTALQGAELAVDEGDQELTQRELQNELICPALIEHPRKATQLLSRIRCAYAHTVEQAAAR